LLNGKRNGSKKLDSGVRELTVDESKKVA